MTTPGALNPFSDASVALQTALLSAPTPIAYFEGDEFRVIGRAHV